jgi:hypothetical protein
MIQTVYAFLNQRKSQIVFEPGMGLFSRDGVKEDQM